MRVQVRRGGDSGDLLRQSDAVGQPRGDVKGVLAEVEGAVVYALANAILNVPSRGSVRCLTRPLCAPVAIAPASGREIAVRDGCNGDVVLLRADDGAVTARVRARASVVLHVRTQ